MKMIKKDKLILVILFGILLLIIALPTKDKNSSDISENTEITTQVSYEKVLEEKLENILSKVEGVGNVKVMITLKNSKEKVVKSDDTMSEEIIEEADNAGGKRVTSNKEYSQKVIFDGEEPYVIKEIEPVIEGVIVIAKGADNSVVAGEISGAIQSLFNVPAHKIKVMKMQ